MIGNKYKKIFIYVVLSIVAILQASPLIIALLNSFRTNGEIKKSPIGIPTSINVDNYVNAWVMGKYDTAFYNSLKVSVIVTIIVFILSLVMGYFLAKSTFKLGNIIVLYLGVALSIPLFAYMVQLYYSFSSIGVFLQKFGFDSGDFSLINSHVGIIIIYIAMNLPFNILLARNFIMDIPDALIEATVIDGGSTFDIIAKIIFPLSKPIITTILLIVFVVTWNEFTIANTFLQEMELKTVATRYVLFVGERSVDMSMVYTAGIITMLPIIVVFVGLQNYFIDGMTAGSLK